MKRSMLIQLRIEHARNLLYTLAEKHRGVQHPAVIKQSMILDDLINQYNKEGTQKKAD